MEYLNGDFANASKRQQEISIAKKCKTTK